MMFRSLLVLCSLAFTQGFGVVHDPSSMVDVVSHAAVALTGKVSHAYTDSLVQHPLYTKMATGGILATCGDAIAQSRTDEKYDTSRAFSFCSFDMCYRALQHVAFPIIVHQCHGQFLGPLASNLPTDYAAAMEQTLASQLGIVPFLYYPVFFSLTGFLQGISPEAALERAKENFIPLMKRNLLFWIPVQFVQFGFIDEQLQIPFLSVAGLCWTFILSVAAGSAKGYNSSEEQIAQQEESAPLVNSGRTSVASVSARAKAN